MAILTTDSRLFREPLMAEFNRRGLAEVSQYFRADFAVFLSLVNECLVSLGANADELVAIPPPRVYLSTPEAWSQSRAVKEDLAEFGYAPSAFYMRDQHAVFLGDRASKVLLDPDGHNVKGRSGLFASLFHEYLHAISAADSLELPEEMAVEEGLVISAYNSLRQPLLERLGLTDILPSEQAADLSYSAEGQTAQFLIELAQRTPQLAAQVTAEESGHWYRAVNDGSGKLALWLLALNGPEQRAPALAELIVRRHPRAEPAVIGRSIERAFVRSQEVELQWRVTFADRGKITAFKEPRSPLPALEKHFTRLLSPEQERRPALPSLAVAARRLPPEANIEPDFGPRRD